MVFVYLAAGILIYFSPGLFSNIEDYQRILLATLLVCYGIYRIAKFYNELKNENDT